MPGSVVPREFPDKVRLLLLVRRSCRRVGTRYACRGMDDRGDVANFLEVEQVVDLSVNGESTDGYVSENWTPPGLTEGITPRKLRLPNVFSLVQIRGSIPLFWEQNATGVPEFTREHPTFAKEAFRRHQAGLERLYGRILYMNLCTERKAGEQMLVDALKNQVQEHLSDVRRRRRSLRLRHFDFHHHVGSIEDLMPHVAKWSGEIDSFGFCSDVGFPSFDAYDNDAVPPGEGPHSHCNDIGLPDDGWRQTGVVRTNCMDCLDRTNLTQFGIAWSWLQGLLFAATISKERERAVAKAISSVKDKVRLDLQSLWGEMGDIISEQTTGAPSILTAMLVSGRYSAWQHGSVQRTYNALVEDANRQECLDALLCSSDLSERFS
ncbi:unnamed protein product, partial [Amoebophrya sp. A25]|eukprot:GSA25T00005202001.1